jgi:hypothetical protein
MRFSSIHLTCISYVTTWLLVCLDYLEGALFMHYTSLNLFDDCVVVWHYQGSHDTKHLYNSTPQKNTKATTLVLILLTRGIAYHFLAFDRDTFLPPPTLLERLGRSSFFLV